MTLPQILATLPHLKKEVYDRYPSTKKERQGCAMEKARLDALRAAYAKRLMVDEREKYEYGSKN